MTEAFDTLGVRAELLRAVSELGYEQPTPIQVRAIPPLLDGRDVLGQAQTGTGKTAAFALPLLTHLDPADLRVQGLVLTPTRELALQVAEAVHSYGKYLGAHVLPVYGGQAYYRQIRRLEQGVHIVVGTPGRLIDLIERGVLKLDQVRYLVLDEADEMLKMGFIEDVERILVETPSARQTALFSATLPVEIRRLADRYLDDPVAITIETKALTVPQTEQRHYLLHQESKLAALARLLEIEGITSALIFTRTKAGAADLAEALQTRGFHAEALHGDLSQEMRETVLRRFRSGQVVYLVATDVVARGIDIQNVSHVVNFDIPNDAEDYVHRIGRTGRAGREGVAITLVTPRERRWLHTIEEFTRQRIPRAKLPPADEVRARRAERFIASLTALVTEDDLAAERALVAQLVEAGWHVDDIVAAAVRLARQHEAQRPIEDVREVSERPARDYDARSQEQRRPMGRGRAQETGMVRMVVNVGKAQGVRPGDIVGAIAGETGIPGKAIGAITILDEQTLVDIGEQYVQRVLRQGGRLRLRGQAARLAVADEGSVRTHAPRSNGRHQRHRKPEHA